MTSPQSAFSPNHIIHQQQQQQQQQLLPVSRTWRSRENILSPTALQHQQQLQQQIQNLNDKTSNNRGLGFMKSRFYSASSETVNNNNNNNNSNNNNINYLVSPPPHYPSQLKRFSPFFTQANTQPAAAVATHKSLENLDGLDQANSTPRHNLPTSTNPSQFSHQKRRRPLYSHNNPYNSTTTSKDVDQSFGVIPGSML